MKQRLLVLMSVLDLNVNDLLDRVSKGDGCYAESTLKKVLGGKGSDKATKAVVEYLEELNEIINGKPAQEVQEPTIEEVLMKAKKKELEGNMTKKEMLQFYYSIYEPAFDEFEEIEKNTVPFRGWEKESFCDFWGRPLPVEGTVRRSPGYNVPLDENEGEWNDLDFGNGYGEEA